MKKFFLATASALALLGGSAAAADLVPEIQTPAQFNWGGFYVGADVGAAWASNVWQDRFNGAFSASYQGFGALAGVHGGWNYQMGPAVIGVEGNFDFTNPNGSVILANQIGLNGGGTANLATQVNGLATFVARGGVSTGSVLYYLLGGLALDSSTHTAQINNGGLAQQAITQTGAGFVLGAGAEFAVTHNFSAKLEYNYIDFGTTNTSFPVLIGHSIALNQQVQVLKVGLSYLFH